MYHSYNNNTRTCSCFVKGLYQFLDSFFFVRALSFEQTGSFSSAVQARKWRNTVESPASVIKVDNQILVPFPLCSPQKRTISENLLVFFSFLCWNYLIQIVFEVSDILFYTDCNVPWTMRYCDQFVGFPVRCLLFHGLDDYQWVLLIDEKRNLKHL